MLAELLRYSSETALYRVCMSSIERNCLLLYTASYLWPAADHCYNCI